MRESPDHASEALKHCLVDEEGATLRLRRGRPVSLVLSVALQAVLLGAALLVPLLVNGEKITATFLTPSPPYRGVPHPKNTEPQSEPRRAQAARPQPTTALTAPPQIPDRVAPINDLQDSTETGPPISPNEIGLPEGLVPHGPSTMTPLAPRPPISPRETPAERRRIRVTVIEPSQLIHRVQPVYPPIARQGRIEGRVELRAVIGRDGRIQELEVVRGNPIFFRETLDAVQQWRYRPTILNGEPVEVETHITVIFVMNH